MTPAGNCRGFLLFIARLFSGDLRHMKGAAFDPCLSTPLVYPLIKKGNIYGFSRPLRISLITETDYT
jgi:hypothetical protein